MAQKSKAPDWEPRSKVVGLILSHASNFSTSNCKKINKASPVRIIAISSDSNKGRDGP